MDSMHATAGGRRETDEEPGVGVVPSNVFETVALLGRAKRGGKFSASTPPPRCS